MPKKIAPVPKGFRTITPSLVVRGADHALNFYANVFGAEILSRMYADVVGRMWNGGKTSNPL